MKVLLILAVFFSLPVAQAKPLSVKEKKSQFLKLVVPAVEKVYSTLSLQHEDISNNLNNPKYTQKIEQLKLLYKAKTDDELLTKLKPHPKSIAIAQAAIESAWATSRFYKEANNLFGVWSYNKEEPRIAALGSRTGKTIWIKKYNNVDESVKSYYKTLARSYAYKEFRELKMKTDNPFELIKKLEKFSELREEYTKMLEQVIRYNKFYIYDNKTK